jgi:hypothetical protein
MMSSAPTAPPPPNGVTPGSPIPGRLRTINALRPAGPPRPRPNLPNRHSQKSSNFISLPLNAPPIRASSPHPTPMLKLRRAENYFPQSPRR